VVVGHRSIAARSGLVLHNAERLGRPVGVGIGDAEGAENLGFEALHDKGLVVGKVIIAKDMQKSMDHKMGEVIVKADALLGRLALQRLAGEDDVAEQAGDRRHRLDPREGEHVGGLVDAAPGGVELLLLGIAGEDDAELGSAGDLRPRLPQRFENGGLGERFEAFRPAVVVACKRDLERDFGVGAQRWRLSSAAVLRTPSAS
jgi:hypothetical protein